MTWNSLLLVVAMLLLAKGTVLMIWPGRAEGWESRKYSRLIGVDPVPPALADQPFYRTAGAALCLAAFVLTLVAEQVKG